MRKVLIVDFNATAPTYNYYFVNGLQKEGLKIDVLGVENFTFTAIHENRLNFIGFQKYPKLLNYILNWVKLFFIASRYQAVHFQWLPMLKHSAIELYLIRVIKVINPNIFYTIHNFYPHDSYNQKINNRYNRLYRLLDNFVIHAESTNTKIINLIGPKRTIKINHGYFYSEFRDSESVLKTYELSVLGNILPYKGIEDALEAIEILKKFGTNVRILIAGKCSSQYLEKLERSIKEKGIQDLVSFDIGFLSVEQLIKYYKKSLFSIMPYKEIEQSGVLFTSLGLGTPVIGYNLGGFVEAIINGENGFLVPMNNIDALAKAIRKGIKNHENLVERMNNTNQKDLWLENAIIMKEAYFR